MRSLFLLTTAFMVLSAANAEENTYGMSTTLVTTSVVKKINKNLGKLQVMISTNCQDSQDLANAAIDASSEQISAAVDAELSQLGLKGIALDDQSQVKHPMESLKYQLRYPSESSDMMAYIASCNNEVVGLNGLSFDDVTSLGSELTFGSSMVMTFVATENIAKLVQLKQRLSDKASAWNKAEVAEKKKMAVNVAVSFPAFGIDEESQEKLKAELLANLGLESQDTQISVDEAFYKKFTGAGFAEKYINTNAQASSTYSSTRPNLLENGSIELKKSFFFTVSYLPTNLGSDEAAAPGVQTKDFVIETEMTLPESDVESYVTDIKVGTQCQLKRSDANLVFKEAFNKAKDAAEKELALAGSSDANAVRIDDVQSPYEAYADIAVGRELVEFTVNQPGADGVERPVTSQRWENTLWLDSCSGKLNTKENRTPYWSVSQSFKVHTDSFATYERVKQIAKDSLGQPQEGASNLDRQQYPIVIPQDNPVVLKDESWRQAVDAEMYEQSLYKLTDPQGEVAKHLSSDYVQASSAYYSLGQSFLAGGPRSMSFESAALDDSASSKSYDGSEVVVDDSNLSPHVERAAKSYTIVWKPEVDLMGLIEARRMAEQNPEMPLK